MFVMTNFSKQILLELQHFSNTDGLMLTPPNIDKFWKPQTIRITPKEEKEDNEAVMDHFNRSMKKA